LCAGLSGGGRASIDAAHALVGLSAWGQRWGAIAGGLWAVGGSFLFVQYLVSAVFDAAVYVAVSGVILLVRLWIVWAPSEGPRPHGPESRWQPQTRHTTDRRLAPHQLCGGTASRLGHSESIFVRGNVSHLSANSAASNFPTLGRSRYVQRLSPPRSTETFSRYFGAEMIFV
jgi:hypothetical protein